MNESPPPSDSAPGRTGPTLVEVFFDGDCPLCKREVALLHRLDRRGRIDFTDIAAAGFRPEEPGPTMDELMAELHGRLPDGRWIRGVEVLRQMYSAVGIPGMSLTRLPGIAWMLDTAYRLFARNRLRLTGRCSASGAECRIDPAVRDSDPTTPAKGV